MNIKNFSFNRKYHVYDLYDNLLLYSISQRSLYILRYILFMKLILIRYTHV